MKGMPWVYNKTQVHKLYLICLSVEEKVHKNFFLKQSLFFMFSSSPLTRAHAHNGAMQLCWKIIILNPQIISPFFRFQSFLNM